MIIIPTFDSLINTNFRDVAGQQLSLLRKLQKNFIVFVHSTCFPQASFLQSAESVRGGESKTKGENSNETFHFSRLLEFILNRIKLAQISLCI